MHVSVGTSLHLLYLHILQPSNETWARAQTQELRLRPSEAHEEALEHPELPARVLLGTFAAGEAEHCIPGRGGYVLTAQTLRRQLCAVLALSVQQYRACCFLCATCIFSSVFLACGIGKALAGEQALGTLFTCLDIN